MHIKNMVKGFPLIEKPERVCEGCIFGKQHIKNFLARKSYRTHTPLESVNFDICGPMQTPSIGGYNYFLSFIDDFTRKTWVYFLKHNMMYLDLFSGLRHLWRTKVVTASRY